MSTCQLCLLSTFAVNRMAVKIQTLCSGQIGFKHRAGFVHRNENSIWICFRHIYLVFGTTFSEYMRRRWVWVTRRGDDTGADLFFFDLFFSSSPSVSCVIGPSAVTWCETNARQIECGYRLFCKLPHSFSLSFSLSCSPSLSFSLSLPPYLQFSAAQWVIKPGCSPVWNNFTAAEICPNVPACTDDWRGESTGMAKTGEAFRSTIWHSLLMNHVERLQTHCSFLFQKKNFFYEKKVPFTRLDICFLHMLKLLFIIEVYYIILRHLHSQ